MVTIRNDIEANGNANRAADSPASAVDGVKNVNHLANGSRRSTMADIKPKAFNRKCVGLLALIVCVGVCFGVGMLFLYGHLVDRLNESASHGSMLHDKNGNPVKPFTTTTAATTTAAAVTSTITSSTSTTTEMVTSIPTTVTEETTEIDVTSTTQISHGMPKPVKARLGRIMFDSWVPKMNDPPPQVSVETTSARIEGTKDKAHVSQRTKPKAPLSDAPPSGRGDFSGDDTDDDDYAESGSGSGSGE